MNRPVIRGAGGLFAFLRAMGVPLPFAQGHFGFKKGYLRRAVHCISGPPAAFFLQLTVLSEKRLKPSGAPLT